MGFKSRVGNFMKGRYGPDELYLFLFKFYIVLFILNLFINLYIITIIELILISIIFYRYFSKKIYKRSNENKKFLELKNKIFNRRKKYKGDYVYKRCRKCKTILKLPLPYEIGIKTTKCPKCKKKIKLLVLRKQKVEIVK